MSDPFKTVESKVRDIFVEMVGERANRLDGSIVSVLAKDAATAALVEEYGIETAADIAFHMTDWNWDAAFIVALHLFPERFTAEEICAGFGMFLVHAPKSYPRGVPAHVSLCLGELSQ